MRIYMKDYRWCSLNPKSATDASKFKELISRKKHRTNGWVAAVNIQSNEEYSNKDRLRDTSQIIDQILRSTEGDGIITFPGGWFSSGGHKAREKYKWAEENLKHILKKEKRNIIACIGVDGREAKDQIGVAISKKGIEAIGRKFYPTKYEKEVIKIEIAKDHRAREAGKSRIFELNGKKYFICVCYDIFGIKRKKLQGLGVNAILDLVHGFYPKGEGLSGDVNFARHGLAGASNQWKCPVFCATVFFRREIPERFPSGVYWDRGSTHSSKCTYENITVYPDKEINIKTKEGKANVRIYLL